MKTEQHIIIEQHTDNAAINLALDTIRINKQALLFVNSKRSAEKTAEDLSKKINSNGFDAEVSQALAGLSEDALKSLPKPTKQCERLSFCLKKGIAFHHAGLTQHQKELIEDNFRNGRVKIICCTPTLAAGVDLPSFRTILKDLKRFGQRGMDWIYVLEYEQMAGRSGRPSFDNYGEAIAVASTAIEAKKIYEKYLCGVPEDIQSKLAVEPVLRTYLLSLIASEFVSTEEEILNFFSKTFWAEQFGDMYHLNKIINKMLALLEEYGFIARASGKKDFISAAEINEGKIKATTIGKRVAELYIDPLTAHSLITCLEKSRNMKKKAAANEAIEANEFSFLQMICSQLEIRPRLNVKTKEWEEVQQKLMELNNFLLMEEPDIYDPDYDDFLASVKTALFFDEWMDEKDEEFLMEKYGIRPGEIKVKLDTADWLLYSAEELAKLIKYHDVVKLVIKTRFRLKYGAKEELLALLKLSGIGRVRARKLFSNGIKTIEDVKKADIGMLSQLLGKGIAVDIKRQVGQEFREDKIKIKENKRKGQISLLDY